MRTPLGKGVVEAVRNNGRVVVRIQGRAVVLEARDLVLEATPKSRRMTEADVETPPSGSISGSRGSGPGRAVSVDLHGLIVEQALERAATALNDALLADVAEIHFIHGRSGGRIRSALHRWLRATPSIRAMRLDARNAGVTIVTL